MVQLMISPAAWGPAEVEQWGRQILLSDEALEALAENEVDGPVLLTITKRDLIDELRIRSMATRRYLWDAIESVRNQNDSYDLKEAIDLHSLEVERIVDHTPETLSLDPCVIEVLRNEIAGRRQVIEDGNAARNIQAFGRDVHPSTYDDAELAEATQEELERLRIQEGYDHAYAATLATGREARQIQRDQRRVSESGSVRSLFGSCIDVCVKNRINVAQALQDGTVSILSQSSDISESVAVGNLKSDLSESRPNIDLPRTNNRSKIKLSRGNKSKVQSDTKLRMKLPRVDCNSCYENKRGFELACEHNICKSCLTGLMNTALGDSSLLPLKCCNIHIDMNVASICLPKDKFEKIQSRTLELETKNKMYCPNCNSFLNLDLVDSSESPNFLCSCGTNLCLHCRSIAHDGLTCEQNRAKKPDANEAEFLNLVEAKNWRRCPGCFAVISLASGCNHMTCTNCTKEFCYQCLSDWNTRSGNCASGRCEIWEEENLIEGGEERVQALEARAGRAFAPVERERQLQRAMRGLRQNEHCYHNWVRRNLRGECERCGFILNMYGMVCSGDCNSTVCYTCAHHRIPRVGWR